MRTNSSEFGFDGLVVLLSVVYSLSAVVILMVCACCRKNSQRNDFLGVDGMVKIKNPDENVNHLPVGKYENFPEFDESKRTTTGSNPHRSLPDIPVYLDGENGASGDTCSDLYATVDDKKGNIPNGEIHSSENPYDRLKKENPYAKVQMEQDSVVASTSAASEQQIAVSTNDHVEIPAAVAVAGRVAASNDLPYMTPPIENAHEDVEIAPQQHFSGDSQDSSKGYTSISVREPLAHIRKQTRLIEKSHYATVSDDSDNDNMYAAIVEPPNDVQQQDIYEGSNGSETYAQIQPVTIVEVHTEDHQNSAPPKNVLHSRQASSSSCTSSVANVGSPKPEKRQANSPLPPTPPAINTLHESNHKGATAARNLEDMYAKVQKNKRKTEFEFESNPTTSEDIHRKPPNHQKLKQENRQSWSSQMSHDFNEIEVGLDSDSSSNGKTIPTHIDEEHCYETLNKKNRKADTGYEMIGTNKNAADPGYEQLSLSRISSETDPNYEILRPNNDGYSSIKKEENRAMYSVVNKKGKSNPDPGYEELRNQNDEPNYESINQKSSESESDPNYESVKYLDVSKSEPPYEKLESNNSDVSEYEQISKEDNVEYKKINSQSSTDTGTFSSTPDNGRSEHVDNQTVEEIIEKNNENENMYFQI